MESLRLFILVFFLTIVSVQTLGHKGIDHGQVESDQRPGRQDLKAFTEINELYLIEIKPIFESSCLDCHGSSNMPWYHFLPIANGIMNSDVKEAKKHLDMRNDFPFAGHGTPKEDLQAIKESIKNGEMPPLRYKVMHWSSGLSKKEQQIVENWVNISLKILKDSEEKNR